MKHRPKETSMPTDQQRSQPDKYAAREPRDEAGRLDAQVGPAQQLAQAGAHAAGEDVTKPGAPRDGRGVR
jgi:hypothetical protein